MATQTPPQQKLTAQQLAASVTGADLTLFKGRVHEFQKSTNFLIGNKPKPYSAGTHVLGDIVGITSLGHNPVSNSEKKELEAWQRGITKQAYSGSDMQIELNKFGETISSQALQAQSEFQAKAKQQLEDIEKGTIETYQRGLLGGQTVKEISSAQRAKRLGFITEAANQQKAALYAQNQFSQQQAQMQGRQEQLRTQQLTGARGIGNSSVQDQLLASQQQNTVNQQAQSQEQLGQGLFTVNEQSSKQTAEINSEINKDMQQKTLDMQNAFDVSNEQARQKIIEDQQQSITQVQHAYQDKRVEIDEMVRKIGASISDLRAAK